MEPQELANGLRRTVWVLLVAGGLIAIGAPAWARDFVFAGLWSVVNLRAWQGVVQSGVVERNVARTLLWGLIKLPILFGVGIFYIVKIGDPAFSALLSGFHVVFAVLLIQYLMEKARPGVSAGAKRGE